MTAVSACMTMKRFAREDRLYACWLLISTGYLLAAIRYALRVVTLVNGTTFNQTMLNAMLIPQNAAIAIALFLFVRAWRATGLAAPGSRSTQMMWIAIGIIKNAHWPRARRRDSRRSGAVRIRGERRAKKDDSGVIGQVRSSAAITSSAIISKSLLESSCW